MHAVVRLIVTDDGLVLNCNIQTPLSIGFPRFFTHYHIPVSPGTEDILPLDRLFISSYCDLSKSDFSPLGREMTSASLKQVDVVVACLEIDY